MPRAQPRTHFESRSYPHPADDVIYFKCGPKKRSDLFGLNKDVPTLDLHGLTINEAREWTGKFLRAQSIRSNLAIGGQYSFGSLATNRMPSKTFKIITGRGLHSPERVAKIKPVVEDILKQLNLQYTVTDNGGAFTIIQ